MNIYDIAKEAGVSIATVSRVINNKKNISKKTKDNVEAILAKHSYTPNAIARGLMVQTMKTIGIVTVDIRDPHYATTAFTIEQDFSKLGYNVILCNTGDKRPESINYIRMLAEKQVDGIILIGSIFNDDEIRTTVLSYAKNIPIVLANGYLDIENSYSVLVDDSYGISLCVDHLYQKNHTNIVYVKDADTYSANQKKDGFIATMKKYDLELDDNSIITVDRGLKGGYEAVEKLVYLHKDFTAIIFGEDITAIGGIKKLKELGKSIPKDVAVTGFNNSIFSECSDPELTSIDNKVETVGSLSVHLLNDLIEKKNATSNILIRPNLIVRKSS
jgi:LacI family transcriptional regulator